jgi:TonB family protein
MMVNDSATALTCFKLSGEPETKDCYYERDAIFEGGDIAWVEYLMRTLERNAPRKFWAGIISGIVILKFVVEPDGKLSNVTVESSSGYDELDATAVRIIKRSPRWIPAVQFGRKVRAYRRQPITFLTPR